MRFCVFLSAAAFGLVCIMGMFGQDAQRSAASSVVRNVHAFTAQTTSQMAIPSYPNTAKGLENFMKDMMALEKKDDKLRVATYSRSLVLPNAETWFKSVFGEKQGQEMAVVSERARTEIEMSASDTLADMLRDKQTHVEAVLLDESCNSRTTPAEYSFLILRQRQEPFYDVRFRGTSGAESIWAYFAYVDDRFRYIGNFQKVETPTERPKSPGSSGLNLSQSSSENVPQRIRLGGNIQKAKLVCQVLPVYPEAAKQSHVQGEVVLHAIIAKDGTIKNLELMSGASILVQPSLEAVSRWRYKPTLFNGAPVEVDTTITVVFSLGPPRPY